MKVAVLGCGNMGKAVVSGLLSSGVEVLVFDKSKETLDSVDSSAKYCKPEDWKQNGVDVAIIAVKPQHVSGALEIFVETDFSPLWISIAAGVSIEKITNTLGVDSKVCRVMPNTPALINKGVSVYALNKNCTEADEKSVGIVLSSLGEYLSLSESQMDAVTGLSGSGPAYVYLFIESLIEGGINVGLSYDVASKLAVETVIGAAEMVKQTRELPFELKRRVMSPGGTTVEGLSVLENRAFKSTVISAVKAAADKSKRLS